MTALHLVDKNNSVERLPVFIPGGYRSGTNEDPYGQVVKFKFKELSGEKLDRDEFSYIEKVDSYGKTEALAIYTDFTGYSIYAHVYAPGKLSRKLIKSLLEFPFNVAKITNLFIPIKASKIPSQDAARKLGFYVWSTIDNVYGPDDKDDILIFCAQKSDISRWL